jgi:hypothetical protein
LPGGQLPGSRAGLRRLQAVGNGEQRARRDWGNIFLAVVVVFAFAAFVWMAAQFLIPYVLVWIWG